MDIRYIPRTIPQIMRCRETFRFNFYILGFNFPLIYGGGKMIGIYKIKNLINGKCYIGQSKNIESRWADHKAAIYNDRQPTYNYPLYKAIRKYGLTNFSFEVIEECSVEDLNTREIFWIEYYNSYNNGYNQICSGYNAPF